LTIKCIFTHRYGNPWYNEHVNEAAMGTIEVYGNSFEFNIVFLHVFGLGGGGFASYNAQGDIFRYGLYGSGGWGVGASMRFDYSKTRRIVPVKN